MTKTGRGSTQEGMCLAVQTPSFSNSCYWPSLTGNQLAKENCLQSPNASITDHIRIEWAWSGEPIIYLFGFNYLFLFWLHWVFAAAAHGLSLVTWVGVLLVTELGFLIVVTLLVRSTPSRVWALEHGRACSLITKMPLSYWKESIWISSNEVDETGAYYTEWSKPERKTPIQYTNAYIWNLERW